MGDRLMGKEKRFENKFLKTDSLTNLVKLTPRSILEDIGSD